MRVFHAVLLSIGLFTAACAISEPPPTAEDPARTDDEAALVSSVASELDRVVAPGCPQPVVCAGTKTCTPYSSFTSCGAAIPACCGFVGRNGHCSLAGETLPQTRTRTCVMRATGATCVETQYRELSSCPTE